MTGVLYAVCWLSSELETDIEFYSTEQEAMFMVGELIRVYQHVPTYGDALSIKMLRVVGEVIEVQGGLVLRPIDEVKG